MGDNAAALKAAEALVTALKNTSSPSPTQHLELLKLSNSVTTLLETPYDIGTKFVEILGLSGALYTLVKTGAIEEVPSFGSITAEDLATAVNIPTTAIKRLMRMALVNGIFTEPSPSVYAHNPLSQSFRLSALGGLILISVEHNKATVALPDYFKSHTSSDFFDLKKSPYAFSRSQEGKTYYEVLDADVEYRPVWNAILSVMDKNMPILGMFPWETLKEQVEKEPERPFVVDIGGGRGQALLKLQEEIPGAFGGRLILQDLEAVIGTLGDGDTPGIEGMVYNAFEEQPVKNAHVYFMRRFLHDFYNGIEFLKNTAKAMGPDSRLIICDMLVPEKVEVYGSQEVYWLDLNLMAMSGQERTLSEFNEIFDAAGLELVKVYSLGVGATVQLEARLERLRVRTEHNKSSI
ncbi:S-adenosyl-L-methionine-dependent methyltransferase [Cercophora newfieldiana]|uniref:S-adenosyl-L-methionine-dependent methyltransferase n=1 Tax=Cercophora newfieldiana TaxID=92897 RepID=A0AA39YI99_9PEZI|nr:S-adenosyl-L-methionine-dependent methyltransferase [Cercophora newfieldiana]